MSTKTGAGVARRLAKPSARSSGAIRIELEQLDQAYHFSATSPEGHVVHLDAATTVGGSDQGVRPMQLLLMGLGGCSGIDIVNILRKQKQPFESLKITVDGKRQKDVEPALFETIEVTFILEGQLNPAKVLRAADLSMQKYCSVTKILEKTAEITYSVNINGEPV